MLYDDRIDVSKGIDVSKTSATKNSFRVTIRNFQINDLSFNYLSIMVNILMSIGIDSIATLNIHGVDYRRIINKRINKSAAVNLLRNTD